MSYAPHNSEEEQEQDEYEVEGDRVDSRTHSQRQPRISKSKRKIPSQQGLMATFGFKSTDRTTSVDQMVATRTISVRKHVTESEDELLNEEDGEEDDEEDDDYVASPVVLPKRTKSHKAKSQQAKSSEVIVTRTVPRRTKKATVSYADPDSSDDFDEDSSVQVITLACTCAHCDDIII